MRVEVRALIVESGRVAVVEWIRHGEKRLSLPGGRVERWESTAEALVREVREELQVEVEAGSFVAAFEAVGRYKLQDLNLIFNAQLVDPSDASRLLFVDPRQPPDIVYPPVLNALVPSITGDGIQRSWLGNVWRPSVERGGDLTDA
jgi:ADP-ribose pyrophosphatase YjhB (NUDIX family)